jgi:hypothetical protein
VRFRLDALKSFTPQRRQSLWLFGPGPCALLPWRSKTLFTPWGFTLIGVRCPVAHRVAAPRPARGGQMETSAFDISDIRARRPNCRSWPEGDDPVWAIDMMKRTLASTQRSSRF